VRQASGKEKENNVVVGNRRKRIEIRRDEGSGSYQTKEMKWHQNAVLLRENSRGGRKTHALGKQVRLRSTRPVGNQAFRVTTKGTNETLGCRKRNAIDDQRSEKARDRPNKKKEQHPQPPPKRQQATDTEDQKRKPVPDRHKPPPHIRQQADKHRQGGPNEKGKVRLNRKMGALR